MDKHAVLAALRASLTEELARFKARALDAAEAATHEENKPEGDDKITFMKMNFDKNPVTPATYRVTGIPTLNVYQNGEVVRQIVGAKPKAALLNELRDFIS